MTSLPTTEGSLATTMSVDNDPFFILAGNRRRSATDFILAVSDQPVKGEKPYPNTMISFSDEDYPPHTMKPHEGALIIMAQVGPVNMRRIVIDNDSSMDILYNHAYQMIDLGGWKMEIGQQCPDSCDQHH